MSKESSKDTVQKTYYDRGIKLFEEMINYCNQDPQLKQLAQIHLNDHSKVINKNGNRQSKDEIPILDKRPEGHEKRKIALENLIAKATNIPEISEEQKKYLNAVQKVLDKDHERYNHVLKLEQEYIKAGVATNNQDLLEQYKTNSRQEVEELVKQAKIAKEAVQNVQSKPINEANVQSKPINEANVQSKPINEVRSKELLDLGKHCQNVGKTNATLNGFVNKYLNKDFILAISVPNENILDLKSQHRLKTAMAIEKMGEEAQKSPNLSPDEKLFLKEVAAIAKDIKEQSITQNELAAKQAELVGKLEENPQSANPQLQTEIGNLQKKSNELEAKIVSRNRQPLPLPANHHSLIELNRNDNQLLDTLLKKDKKPNMGVFQKEYLDQKYIDQMQPDPYYSLNKQSRAIQQKAMAIEKMGEEAQKNPNLSPDEKLAMKKAADMARNIRSQSEEAHHFEREKAYFLPRLSNPNIPPEQKNRLLAEYKKREARHEEYIFKRNEMMLNSKLPPIQKHVSKVDSQKSVRQEAQQIGNDLNKQLLSSSKQVIRQVIKNYFRKNNRSQGR